MSQNNIDYGSFPDDPSADAIRTAFNKVQNNFNQLFAANANSAVTSINRTPGAGVTVNYPTGNVIISANIACVKVSTSSLSVGIGGNGGTNATMVTSAQTLVIDIDPDQVLSNYFANPSNGLAVFNGTLSANSNAQPNITSLGTLLSLEVAGNITTSNLSITGTSNLGNSTAANYFIGSGNNLSNIQGANVSGAVSFATTANSVAVANVSGIGNIATVNLDGNVSNVLRGNGTWGADANSSYGDSNVVSLLGAFGSNTIVTTGDANVGVLTSTNANLGNAANANYFVGNFYGTANLATYATTANAVDIANVSGAGNIATINLDGNVSNLLTGNGTYVAIPIVPTVGNIATLDLDGNVSNVLRGDGTWSADATGPIAGSNTEIIFNDEGAANGSANLTFDKTTSVLTITGNVSVANVTTTNYFLRSVATGIAAAGTEQANATVITKEINVVSTVESGAGIVLPTAVAGMVITITNTSANSLLVYPAANGIINSLSANAALTQVTNATLQFVAPTTTQWYTT